jgi:hypothetical protein
VQSTVWYKNSEKIAQLNASELQRAAKISTHSSKDPGETTNYTFK